MLDEGEEASHLCHHSTCINPLHITVEPKEANEGRKACLLLSRKRIIKLEGVTTLVVDPAQACACNPPCILEDIVQDARLPLPGE